MDKKTYINKNDSLFSEHHEKEINRLQSIVFFELIILLIIGGIFFTVKSFTNKSQTLAYEHVLTPLRPAERDFEGISLPDKIVI